MGCQKAIATKIVKKQADYVLGLKGNQATLLDEVKLFFDQFTVKEKFTASEKDHGRIEQRTYYLETQIDWLVQQADWEG